VTITSTITPTAAESWGRSSAARRDFEARREPILHGADIAHDISSHRHREASQQTDPPPEHAPPASLLHGAPPTGRLEHERIHSWSSAPTRGGRTESYAATGGGSALSRAGRGLRVDRTRGHDRDDDHSNSGHDAEDPAVGGVAEEAFPVGEGDDEAKRVRVMMPLRIWVLTRSVMRLPGTSATAAPTATATATAIRV
jgi:hypothetical protein